jgi:hypothetical protein
MLTTSRYSIDDIKEEAEQLVHQGRLDRQQCLYTFVSFCLVMSGGVSKQS